MKTLFDLFVLGAMLYLAAEFAHRCVMWLAALIRAKVFLAYNKKDNGGDDASN